MSFDFAVNTAGDGESKGDSSDGRAVVKPLALEPPRGAGDGSTGVEEILSALQSRSVQLWVDRGHLRFRAPKGAMSPELRMRLVEHKEAIIAYLSGRDSAQRGVVEPVSGGFSLTEDLVRLASLEDWVLADQPAYIHRVAPYKGFLYQRLGLDKRFVSGAGAWLVDESGRQVVDFIAQYGAAPFGHDPEEIWQALDQLRHSKRPNLMINALNDAAGDLAERLVALAPAGLEHVVFANSGAEAVEAALKLAKIRTGRSGILATRNGFHGLTLGAVSATGRSFYQRGFSAPVAGFEYLPFGDIGALEGALGAAPEHFAAFIVEPIQGEGGIVPTPKDYLARAAELCRRWGTLLIVDEVQTGLGRTGELFACEYEGITPDILVLAKALGGGLVPIGAALYGPSVFDEAFDIRHGSTMAGNALACSAAMATLERLTRNDRALVRHVRRTGADLRCQLEALRDRHPELIGEIRGRGFMLGVDLKLQHLIDDRSSLLSVLAEQNLLMPLIVSYLLNVEGVRIAASYTAGTTLRIEPPLVATVQDCQVLLTALDRACWVLTHRDVDALLSPLVGRPHDTSSSPPRASVYPRQPLRVTLGVQRRFAFVVHLVAADDLRHFDPRLNHYSTGECEALFKRIAPLLKPFPAASLTVPGEEPVSAVGELVVLPMTATKLMALPATESRSLVQRAVAIAAERGAEVVGLGGFSSIVTAGGLALEAPPGVELTSGNSLTAYVAFESVCQASRARNISLNQSTLVVVGAGGAIGEALSLLFAPLVAKLVLVGSPNSTPQALARLQTLAQRCQGSSTQGTLCQVTRDLATHLPQAQVVVTATSDPSAFISGDDLAPGAIVCDVSRPFNVARDVVQARPDLCYIEGGMLKAPAGSQLGPLERRAGELVACASETIILALSEMRKQSMCGRVDPETALWLGERARALGFRVSLEESAWHVSPRSLAV